METVIANGARRGTNRTNNNKRYINTGPASAGLLFERGPRRASKEVNARRADALQRDAPDDTRTAQAEVF